jgi:hypothetical protein
MATDTLTGITKTAGTCADCSRELTVAVFTVRNADGIERDLGRRCAIKATGWKRPEDGARSAARVAIVAERIAALTAEGMDTVHAGIYAADAWWTGRTAAEIAACWQVAA